MGTPTRGGAALLAFKSKVVGACLLLGLAIAAAIAVSPDYFHLLNPGAMSPGHEGLACTSCHASAPGTIRQQIQANLSYLLGQRKHSVVFGFKAPSSSDCSACHTRPDDSHGIHRFSEPRFVEALARVPANTCIGCHREHQGRRVSSAGEFCSACHGDLKLTNDPVDVSHGTLIAEERWSTCLGCHDYHGNHIRSTQQSLSGAYDAASINAYLANGPDPYAGAKRHKARDRRDR